MSVPTTRYKDTFWHQQKFNLSFSVKLFGCGCVWSGQVTSPLHPDVTMLAHVSFVSMVPAGGNWLRWINQVPVGSKRTSTFLLSIRLRQNNGEKLLHLNGMNSSCILDLLTYLFSLFFFSVESDKSSWGSCSNHSHIYTVTVQILAQRELLFSKDIVQTALFGLFQWNERKIVCLKWQRSI